MARVTIGTPHSQPCSLNPTESPGHLIASPPPLNYGCPGCDLIDTAPSKIFNNALFLQDEDHSDDGSMPKPSPKVAATARFTTASDSLPCSLEMVQDNPSQMDHSGNSNHIIAGPLNKKHAMEDFGPSTSPMPYSVFNETSTPTGITSNGSHHSSNPTVIYGRLLLEEREPHLTPITRRADKAAIRSANRFNKSMNFKSQMRNKTFWAARYGSQNPQSLEMRTSGIDHNNAAEETRDTTQNQETPSALINTCGLTAHMNSEIKATIDIGEVLGFQLADRGRQVMEAILGEGDNILQS